MNKQTPNSEKYDLFRLVHSLNPYELRMFRLYLNKENRKSDVFSHMFEKVKKQSFYDEEKLQGALNLSKEQLRDTKFHLIKSILKCLKHSNRGQRQVYFNGVIELITLQEKGLYRKAIRKFKALKKQAIVDHEFDQVCYLLKRAESLILFEASEDEMIEKILKSKEEYSYYQMLAKNLNEYSTLAVKVLGLGYKFADGRLEDKIMLDFLDHPLLKNESNAKSDLAKGLYYEIKCLIYLGVCDYHKASIYALKGWEHAKKTSSPNRNDYHVLSSCLSNYLHAVLTIGDLEGYLRMVVHFDKLVLENDEHLSILQKSRTFGMQASIKLSYYNITKNCDEFNDKFPEIREKLEWYENIIHPNFKSRIIFYISKLFFLNGNLEQSLEWSNKLYEIQRNNPYYIVLVSNNILRIMIHYDLGNLISIPHLSKSAAYFFKSKNRYFELEKCFIKGICKVKVYHSKSQKEAIFKKLLLDLNELMLNEKNNHINHITGIIEWVESKIN